MRKTAAILVTGILAFSLSPTSAFAEDGSTSEQFPTPPIEGYQVVTEEEETSLDTTATPALQYEGTTIYEPTYMEIQMAAKKNATDPISPGPNYYQEYPDGTTSISKYAYSNGTLIQQDLDQGIANSIWSNGVTVAGFAFKTVGGVLVESANRLVTSIDKYRESTVYAYKSYRYIGKEAKVYNRGSWSKWYEAKSRENFAHTYSSWVNSSGYTKTIQIDFTRDNGYYPVVTNFSPNYNNDSELKNRAWTNWYKGYKYYSYPEYGYRL
jgi:hypothetical protein